MKTQLTFMLAIISAMIITACGGGGGTTQSVPADLSGYTVNDLSGTNAAVAQKLGADGKATEQGYLIGGQKSGQWTTFDADGRISTLTNYIAGMKNGVELKFNSRGMIEAMTSFKNNKLDGLSGTYKNGRPLQEVSYKNGEYDNYTEIIQNISRHFNDKGLMRTKIVEKTLCEPMPQIQLPKKEN